jgi:hypothetical protein
MHRLPHATGMRRCGGDRQSHWDKRTHQQQNQQDSRGQTMHKDYLRDESTKDKSTGIKAQVFRRVVDCDRLHALP